MTDNVSVPSKLRAPAGTASPTIRVRGRFSPVRWTKLTDEAPSMTRPSRGAICPALTRIFVPIRISLIERSIKEPSSITTKACCGESFLREASAPFAFERTESSIAPEKEKRTKRSAPSLPLPISTERKAARVISTSILISRSRISSTEEIRAGIPAKK